MLELADAAIPLQTTFHFQPQEEDEYEPEKILEQRGQKYFVKSKGYPDSDNIWESKAHFKNAPELLRQFHLQNQPREAQTTRARNHRRE